MVAGMEETIAERLYERQLRPAPARHDLISVPGLPDSPWWVERQVDGSRVIRTALHAGQMAVMTSEARNTLMLAGTQGGKALSLDTPIPTPTGLTAIGDLKVGDFARDQDGVPTEITYVSPVFVNHDCYRFEFEGGYSVVADADHAWPLGLKSTGTSWAIREWHTVTSAGLHRLLAAESGLVVGLGSTMERRVLRSYRVASVPTRCIAVAGSSHLYLCGEAAIPTHNTSLGPLWLEREIRVRGKGDYLAITANFPLLSRKMLPEFLRYFEHTLHLGRWQASNKMFVYHDGETRVLFGSAKNPESLEASTANAAWLDECGQDQFRLEAWDATQRRLSIAMGRTLMTTTPYNRGWTKSEVHDKAQAGDPDFCVVQFASTANPRFPKQEYDRVVAAAMASGQMWKVRMFYMGLYDQPPGLIYSVFRDSYRVFGGHLVPAASTIIMPWWPRYVGLDFGGSNTAKLYVAYDPVQNDYYAYHETLSGGLTAAQHVQEILLELNGAPLMGVWGGSRSEDAWRLEFAAAGMNIQEPNTWDVEVGIDRGVALFAAGNFFVLDSMTGFRDELGTYSRQVTPDGVVLPKIIDKNKYHRLDAFRALAQGIGGPAEPLPLLVIGSARGWQPRALR